MTWQHLRPARRRCGPSFPDKVPGGLLVGMNPPEHLQHGMLHDNTGLTLETNLDVLHAYMNHPFNVPSR
eukprot:15996374-Heterocapsa_arctica.AAC.1